MTTKGEEPAFPSITDPLEIIEARVALQEDEVVGGKIPCADCGEWTPLEDCHPSSPRPDAAPLCGECAEASLLAALGEEEGEG